MSKALVIKGANFLANRTRQITISNPVICTGITLNKASVAFTAIGATDTLTATLTPADTTEALTWVSSDTDVATVANGVVTCVGIGTATITATCGTQIATCEVNATVTVNANTAYSAVNGYQFTSNFNSDNTKNYLGGESKNITRSFLDGNNTLSGYRAISSTVDVWEGKYPIPIPKGAKTITISAPSSFSASSWAYALFNANEQTTHSVTPKSARVYRYASVPHSVIDGKQVGTVDISTMDDAVNSFVFQIKTGGADASTVTGDVTVTFS